MNESYVHSPIEGVGQGDGCKRATPKGAVRVILT